MTPAQQRIVSHAPEHGRFGDCARTAVAVILDLEPDDVPNWAEIAQGDPEGMAEVRKEWLRANGVLEVRFPLPDDVYPTLRRVTRFMGQWNPYVDYLVVGLRGETPHEVVGRGDLIVCDPLTGKPHDWHSSPRPLTDSYEGWWHVGVLVTADTPFGAIQ